MSARVRAELRLTFAGVVAVMMNVRMAAALPLYIVGYWWAFWPLMACYLYQLQSLKPRAQHPMLPWGPLDLGQVLSALRSGEEL